MLSFPLIPTCSLPQLVCLNISNNKLFRLDDLSELVNKVPNLKTLNLSHNEVRRLGLVVAQRDLTPALTFTGTAQSLLLLFSYPHNSFSQLTGTRSFLSVSILVSNTCLFYWMFFSCHHSS